MTVIYRCDKCKTKKIEGIDEETGAVVQQSLRLYRMNDFTRFQFPEWYHVCEQCRDEIKKVIEEVQDRYKTKISREVRQLLPLRQLKQ